MTQPSCYKLFFLTCLLWNNHFTLAEKTDKENNKTKRNFTYKTDLFLISRDFLESFFVNHPLLATGIAGTAVWYYLYPEHFNNASQEVLNKIKKIKVGTEEIYWIYEVD